MHRWVVVIFLGLIVPFLASATTYLINPDGTGDFPTIQAAVDAASDGDVIELADGVFIGEGNRGVNWEGTDIALRAELGDPTSCIIDCQNIDRGFAVRLTPSSASIQGITIRNGWVHLDKGGGISLQDGSLSIHNCMFIDNNGSYEGGGIYYRNASLTIDGTIFVGNFADLGAAIGQGPSTSGVINNCTIVANSSPNAVLLSNYVNNTIIAFNGGPPVACNAPPIQFNCTNIYENAGGDWLPCIADQHGIEGNISEDPLFCDPGAGDLNLQEGSPCAPFSTPNEECDLIGALPVGCSGESECWPYPLSYANFEGFSQSSGWYPLTLGLYAWGGESITISEYVDGCWRIPEQVVSLPEYGCDEVTIYVEYDPSSESDCDLLANLELVAWQGPLVVARARHRVVADHGTLDQDDLGIPDWAGYGDLEGLLREYAPIIRLNEGEKYPPIRVEVSLHGASLQTDQAPYGPPFPPEFNEPDISVEDLAQYSWSFFSLDLPCSEWDPDGCYDAYVIAENSVTDPHVVYATAIRDIGPLFDLPEDDYIVVQYYFNYYFNDNETELCDWPYTEIRQVHEGDWEHISIAFDLSLNPIAAAFPAHGAADVVPWANIEKLSGTEHPVVYVSRGGHANYSSSGWHCLSGWNTKEYHLGNGDHYHPEGVAGGDHHYSLEQLPRWADLSEEGEQYRWLEFSGYWGTGEVYKLDRNSRSLILPSPVYYGPAFRHSWTDPIGEEFTNVEFCVGSPVDIVVRDSWGREAGPDTTTIPRARYEVSSVDSAGTEFYRNARVTIPYPLAGEYQIEVIPLEDALPSDTYSLWAIRSRIGVRTDTVVIAEDQPISEIPPMGYDVVPDIPHVGQSQISPDSWDMGWAMNDSVGIEWHLHSPDEAFSLESLLWDSLRLNDTVAPISVAPETTGVGTGLRVILPRGPSVHSIAGAEPNTTRQVLLEGVFDDSLRLEARAQVQLVSTASEMDQEPRARGSFEIRVAPKSASAAVSELMLTLPRAGHVRVDVHDVGGRAVKTLADREYEAGTHRLTWDGRSSTGTPLPSGLYFVCGRWHGDTRRTTMLLLK
ncbi:FlgD immunoglobulin-like domain containing protein [Candidatus Eisenbacteria bacterium]|uniref:FlgD immunoglobulin-like domain containing protein n=1 Tax=Eiseniibacteriota bacterium TaxID=2212470 RepID=A0ABV6YKK8_UNCEI